jgi:hypothetical protein
MAKALDAMTRAWMVEAMKIMADSGIDLSHDASLPTHCVHDGYLMLVFMWQGASTQELILLNQCLILLLVTMIAGVVSGDGKQLMQELFNGHPTENGDTAQCPLQPNQKRSVDTMEETPKGIGQFGINTEIDPTTR